MLVQKKKKEKSQHSIDLGRTNKAPFAFFFFHERSDCSISKQRHTHAPKRELPLMKQDEKEEEDAAAADGAFIADEQGKPIVVIVDLFNSSSTSSSVCAAARARRRRMHWGGGARSGCVSCGGEKLLAMKRLKRQVFTYFSKRLI